MSLRQLAVDFNLQTLRQRKEIWHMGPLPGDMDDKLIAALLSAKQCLDVLDGVIESCRDAIFRHEAEAWAVQQEEAYRARAASEEAWAREQEALHAQRRAEEEAWARRQEELFSYRRRASQDLALLDNMGANDYLANTLAVIDSSRKKRRMSWRDE